MSTKIAPLSAVDVSHATGDVKPAPKAPADPKLHKMAQEFEALFVRQILTAAKIGGHEKENGYDGMAVDALATGIEQGGGLGLVRQIEEALGHAAREPVKK